VSNNKPNWEWQITFGFCIPMVLIAIFTNPLLYETLGKPTTWGYIFSQLIGNAVTGWVIFVTLASAREITNFVSSSTSTNIFDSSPFRPVANWCLFVVIQVMGSITIASLFLGSGLLSVANLAHFGGGSFLGILAFFAGMWSTHQHMLNAKRKELNRINAELLALHHEILAKVSNRELNASRSLMESSASLMAHKAMVEKANDWPYTIGSLGGLVTSVTIPVLINILSRLL
jgi:hypothetical protein